MKHYIGTYTFPDTDDWEYAEIMIIRKEFGEIFDWLDEHAPSHKVFRSLVNDPSIFSIKGVLTVEFDDPKIEVLYRLRWGDRQKSLLT